MTLKFRIKSKSRFRLMSIRRSLCVTEKSILYSSSLLNKKARGGRNKEVVCTCVSVVWKVYSEKEIRTNLKSQGLDGM